MPVIIRNLRDEALRFVVVYHRLLMREKVVVGED
jgi:hypothetical protein